MKLLYFVITCDKKYYSFAKLEFRVESFAKTLRPEIMNGVQPLQAKSKELFL